ncbi:uncharacterized protein BKA78DRAFT_345619 [Phyllosticta capitalensis]|uniref:Uncharacterized protein n=1 Tax=Phyllosticta capitalensis TaxID=121624 RepID=A0ABR1YBD6_9PEZI
MFTLIAALGKSRNVITWTTDEDEPDPEVQRSRQRSLKDNLRWVVTQLRKSNSLSSMLVLQADSEFFDFLGTFDGFASDFRYIFQPLEAIRSLDSVWVKRDTYYGDYAEDVGDEEWSEWAESYRDYALSLERHMTSKEPVKDEPKVFKLYDEFVHNLKKCGLAGTKIDTKFLLEKVQLARDNADTKSFISALNTFSKKFEDEVAQKRGQRKKIELLVDAAELNDESEAEATGRS